MEMDQNYVMSKKYLNIVKKIELARSKNNKNWMDLLRLAIKKAPKQAKLILKRINYQDKNISKLLSKIK
jgi:2-polyprenyl-3-methyl-5-hydroxy-6-metoxy-1,4-benzoquinol methylase